VPRAKALALARVGLRFDARHSAHGAKFVANVCAGRFVHVDLRSNALDVG